MRALGRISLVSFGLATLLGCATPPPPRANPQSSAIGIAVKVEVSFATDEDATRVYFARVNELGALGGPIASNYVNGKYAYLLNIEPGRYVVVAVAYANSGLPGSLGTATYSGGEWHTIPGSPRTGGGANTVYAPHALVDESSVTVREGEVAFAGEIVVDNSGSWETADEVQQRYYDLLAPGHRERNSLVKALSDQHWVAVGHELDRGVEAQQRFLDHSRTELAGSGWESLLLHPVGVGSPHE